MFQLNNVRIISLTTPYKRYYIIEKKVVLGTWQCHQKIKLKVVFDCYLNIMKCWYLFFGVLDNDADEKLVYLKLLTVGGQVPGFFYRMSVKWLLWICQTDFDNFRNWSSVGDIISIFCFVEVYGQYWIVLL